MSGGSFNYLYLRHETSDGLGRSDEYQRMAASLAARGHYEAAALTLLIATHLDDASKLAKLLAPVMRAEEWCVSGDGSAERVAQAVSEMRVALGGQG